MGKLGTRIGAGAACRDEGVELVEKEDAWTGPPCLCKYLPHLSVLPKCKLDAAVEPGFVQFVVFKDVLCRLP